MQRPLADVEQRARFARPDEVIGRFGRLEVFSFHSQLQCKNARAPWHPRVAVAP
jgi:hypothetical protein